MDVKLVFILLIITEVYSRTEMLDINSDKQYCGSKLADLLSLVCKGRYNTLFDVNNNRRCNLYISMLNNHHFEINKNNLHIVSLNCFRSQ